MPPERNSRHAPGGCAQAGARSGPQIAARRPRSPDNPMAVLARQVLVEAERALDKAEALAAAMEPHLQRRYSDSAIYAYTNERSVPPGDVLLAAALAAGISLDEKLGLPRPRSDTGREIDELRAEMAQLSGVVASLQERLPGSADMPHDRQGLAGPPEDGARRARRRDWARSSEAGPPVQSPPAGRATGRDRRL